LAKPALICDNSGVAKPLEGDAMTEAILAPSGRLDTSASATFEQQVLAELQRAPSWLLIDLSAVAYIASSALRILLMGAKRLGTGRFGVCGLQPQIAEVFEFAGLGSIVMVYPDRETALAALR
jgi:anti-anti-sigma factor